MNDKLEQDIKEYIYNEDYSYVSKYIYELNVEINNLENEIEKLKKNYMDLEKKYNSLSKSKLVKIAYKITRLKRKFV